jgi:hypothetical protein
MTNTEITVVVVQCYSLIGGATLTVRATPQGPLAWDIDGEASEALRGRLSMLPSVWHNLAYVYSEATLDRLVRTRLHPADEPSPPAAPGRDDTQDRLHWDRRDGFDPSRWTKD